MPKLSKAERHLARALQKIKSAVTDQDAYLNSIIPPMSEEQIERVVERETNRLDRLFMSNELSQTEYDRECSTLDKWAQSEYDRHRTFLPRHGDDT